MILKVALEKTIADKFLSIRTNLENRDGSKVTYSDVVRHIIMEYVKD